MPNVNYTYKHSRMSLRDPKVLKLPCWFIQAGMKGLMLFLTADSSVKTQVCVVLFRECLDTAFLHFFVVDCVHLLSVPMTFVFHP